MFLTVEQALDEWHADAQAPDLGGRAQGKHANHMRRGPLRAGGQAPGNIGRGLCSLLPQALPRRLMAAGAADVPSRICLN
jgi:hypothetical protein